MIIILWFELDLIAVVDRLSDFGELVHEELSVDRDGKYLPQSLLSFLIILLFFLGGELSWAPFLRLFWL